MKNVFMNRPLKNPLFWTGTAYLLYLAFALLLFPYIAEKKAVEYVKTEFGRDLVVEKISLNPFTLKLTIKNLFFHEPDGGMFVKWEEFSINPALFPLIKKTLVLQDISLTASEISIVKLKDGTFNFESLIKPGEEKKTETEEKTGVKTAKKPVKTVEKATPKTAAAKKTVKTVKPGAKDAATS